MGQLDVDTGILTQPGDAGDEDTEAQGIVDPNIDTSIDVDTSDLTETPIPLP